MNRFQHKLPSPLRRCLVWLLCFLATLLSSIVAPAVAADSPPPLTLTSLQHDYDVSAISQYLEDPEGALTLDQLLAKGNNAPWQPVKSTFHSFGFTDSVYWYRFNLIHQDSPEEDYFIELHYPLLDEINLYLIQQGKVIDQVRMGDAHPFKNRAYELPTFIYKPSLPSGEMASIYVRVKSESSMLVPLLLWHEHDFYSHQQHELFINGLYFGVLLAFALYNFMLFLFMREPAHFYYSAYIVFFGLFQAALLGLGYQYLWPEASTLQQHSTTLFMLIALFTALRFSLHFLQLDRYCPAGIHAVKILSNIAIVTVFALPFVPYSVAIQFGLLLTFATAILLLTSTITVWRRGQADASYFFFAWVVFIFAVIFSALEKLGIDGLAGLTDYVMQIGVTIQLAIFSLALAKRLHTETQQRMQLQQQTSETLASLVKERTEKLEEANQRLISISVTDALTGLHNRRFFDEEMNREFMSAIRNNTSLSLAMIDIDHFKDINDHYGHQEGDEFLKMIANSLRLELKRPLDTACRYGGEEFAIILPGTAMEGAIQVGEAMRQSVEKLQHKIDNKFIPVTISIGTATLYPKNGDTPDQLIKLADQALYQAKTQGRNRVIAY